MSAVDSRRDVIGCMLHTSIVIVDRMRCDDTYLARPSVYYSPRLQPALWLLALKFFILFFRPQYGGKFCPGSSRIYQLCNINPCHENSLDFRAQQCAEYNSKPFRGWFYQWKPYTKVEGNLVSVPLRLTCLCVDSDVIAEPRRNGCQCDTVFILICGSPDLPWPILQFSCIGFVYFSTPNFSQDTPCLPHL